MTEASKSDIIEALHKLAKEKDRLSREERLTLAEAILTIGTYRVQMNQLEIHLNGFLKDVFDEIRRGNRDAVLVAEGLAIDEKIEEVSDGKSI